MDGNFQQKKTKSRWFAFVCDGNKINEKEKKNSMVRMMMSMTKKGRERGGQKKDME
jgi:hypothetical protein